MLMSNSLLPRSEMLAVPPWDLLVKKIIPPSEPSIPPWAAMLAAAAVVVSMKSSSCPLVPRPCRRDDKAAIGGRRIAGEFDVTAELIARARPDRGEGGFFGGGGPWKQMFAAKNSFRRCSSPRHYPLGENR